VSETYGKRHGSLLCMSPESNRLAKPARNGLDSPPVTRKIVFYMNSSACQLGLTGVRHGSLVGDMHPCATTWRPVVNRDGVKGVDSGAQGTQPPRTTAVKR
jgi:hypothetical protein